MWVIPPPESDPPGWELVYAPKWYRLQWLYYLADDGFFDRAKQGEPPRDGPRYRLSVGGWWEDLGWNAETGKRLDALRKEMLGDAAKEMDSLLKRLEPDRKQWEKAAARPMAPAAAKQAVAVTTMPSYERLSDRIEYMALDDAQHMYFMTPRLLCRLGGEGALYRPQELFVLKGTEIAKRIALDKQWVTTDADGRFAVVGRTEDKKVRVEIYDVAGTKMKEYLAPDIPADMEPSRLIGDHIVALQTKGLEDWVYRYEIVILSPKGTAATVKEPGRVISNFYPCGSDSFLIQTGFFGLKDKQFGCELLNVEGKVRMTQAFPQTDILDAATSPDGKYLLLSDYTHGNEAPPRPSTRELIEIASGKRTPIEPTEACRALFVPEASRLVVGALSGVTCYGYDGKVVWTQRLQGPSYVTLVHLASGLAVAIIQQDVETKAFSLRVFSLADGHEIESLPLTPAKGTGGDVFLSTVPSEVSPGRLALTRTDSQYLVDLTKK
jgi:hypothetical protein